jgi:hypothetical protein
MKFDPVSNADLVISVEEAQRRKATVKSDQAFAALMMKQIRRGKEKPRIGTYVDTTPIRPTSFQRTAVFSGCGSPSQLCTESAISEGGGSTYK